MLVFTAKTSDAKLRAANFARQTSRARLRAANFRARTSHKHVAAANFSKKLKPETTQVCRGSRVELGQSLSCSAEYCLRRLNESKHLSHGISTQQAIDGDKTLQTFWLYCFFPKFHSAKKRPQQINNPLLYDKGLNIRVL